MSANFVLLDCHTCQDVRQVQWPFKNVVKMYCDYCSGCSKMFKLSTEIKSEEEKLGPFSREYIECVRDVPKKIIVMYGNRKFYSAYHFVNNEQFIWYYMDSTELKFPCMLLNYDIYGGHARTYSPGIVTMKQLENFLNEPDFVWWFL